MLLPLDNHVPSGASNECHPASSHALTIYELPVELLQIVMLNLDLKSIGAARQSCHKINEAADETFWLRYAHKHFAFAGPLDVCCRDGHGQAITSLFSTHAVLGVC
jgi:hypothetical protein